MRTSVDRILTTNVGSLARPGPVLDVLHRKAQGEPYDEAELATAVRAAVADVVQRQADSGIDVVGDGEQSKPSFNRYVVDRLSGHSPTTRSAAGFAGSWQQEIEAFPEYYEEYLERTYSTLVQPRETVNCTGPVSYVGHEPLRRDIDNLNTALEHVEVEEAFLTSTGPRPLGANEYYESREAYLHAIADALREEYRAIVDAGFLLQVDDPALVDLLSEDGQTPFQERRRRADEHVELVNYALEGIPEDRVRHHCCYGLNHGPRIHDMAMREVVPFMLKINAGAYSFEQANPRHQHEWRLWEDVVLPEGKVLLPGLLGHAQNYVEHPELISDMIVNFARIVGPQHVIASSDCGFSSQAMYKPELHPSVVWAKFRALADGAALASKRLGMGTRKR